METLNGTIDRVFFSNPDRPWMAGKLRAENGKLVSFSGTLAAPEGESVTLEGGWVDHPKYGRQFEATSGRVRLDETPEGLVRLISDSADFSGIGPARARKIVDAALALSPDGEAITGLRVKTAEVAERAGVPLDVVEALVETWNARAESYAAVSALVDQGWTAAQSEKIVRVLGENAPALVKDNPFMLIGKIARFGFRTVSAVADKMGIAPSDPRRLAAGVAYCLERQAEHGHTWMGYEALIAEAVKELQPNTLQDEILIEDAIGELVTSRLLFSEIEPNGTSILADAHLARAESGAFSRLIAGLTEEVEPLPLTGEDSAEVVATLNDGQAAALDAFSRHRFAVISGGAGVGKTYTMRAVHNVARENGLTVACCAPTGKAAKRLSLSTGAEALTIHRLLEPFHTEDGFKFSRHKGNPVEADLVIVDECSMIDVRLVSSLLDALPSTCRLLLVGDHNQIPSVGPGAILRDLLAGATKFGGAVSVLSKVVRQAGQLDRNTRAILDGVVVNESSPAWAVVPTEPGNYRGAARTAREVVEALVASGDPAIESFFGRPLDLAFDVQVLAPMKNGDLGVHALNVELQALRQRLLGNLPPEPVAKDRKPKPLVGDRVLWTVNDYELGLLNGTQAIVLEARKDGSMLLLTEDGEEKKVSTAKRANVEVCYAMTIHKSQGSEWPAVVLVVGSCHRYMADRNLLYTGASRAAKSLTIVGDAAGLRVYAQSQKSERRSTFGEFMVQGWVPAHLPSVEVPQAS